MPSDATSVSAHASALDRGRGARATEGGGRGFTGRDPGGSTTSPQARLASARAIAPLSSAPPFRAPDTESPPPALQTLTERALCSAVPAAHPLTRGDFIDVDDLRRQRWLAGSLSGADRPMGVWPGLESGPRSCTRHATGWRNCCPGAGGDLDDLKAAVYDLVRCPGVGICLGRAPGPASSASALPCGTPWTPTWGSIAVRGAGPVSAGPKVYPLGLGAPAAPGTDCRLSLPLLDGPSYRHVPSTHPRMRNSLAGPSRGDRRLSGGSRAWPGSS